MAFRFIMVHLATPTGFRARRLALALAAGLTLGPAAAQASFREAQVRFNELPQKEQAAVTLALIATGDFEGLYDFGFTRLLYRAVRSFEAREGLRPDGVLEPDEIDQLKARADAFYAKLGNRYYDHPVTGARLLVPRGLFDKEERTADGYTFSRADGLMSLSFVSFPDSERSYGDLYETLAANGPDKRVIYRRRFDSHFIATGFFTGRKFYTWMARTGNSTTGFTVSWTDAFEPMGRKISVLLANSFVAQPQ